MDKKYIFPAGIVLLLGICILMAILVRSSKAENRQLKARQAELSALKDEALRLRDAVGSAEGKKSLTKVEGVVQATDEVLKSLGMGQKVKSVKPTGSRNKQYATEEEAEVQLEKLSLNEMVNVLYRFENSAMFLSVKKTSIRTTFENPSLLNVIITVSLIKPT
ncbi:MAG: hypothetical protein ACYC69_07555 [Thermodesulfovibrionales bacterium]